MCVAQFDCILIGLFMAPFPSRTYGGIPGYAMRKIKQETFTKQFQLNLLLMERTTAMLGVRYAHTPHANQTEQTRRYCMHAIDVRLPDYV